MLHQLENTCTYSGASPPRSPRPRSPISAPADISWQNPPLFFCLSQHFCSQDRRKVSNFLYLVSRFSFPPYSVHISMYGLKTHLNWVWRWARKGTSILGGHKPNGKLLSKEGEQFLNILLLCKLKSHLNLLI